MSLRALNHHLHSFLVTEGVAGTKRAREDTEEEDDKKEEKRPDPKDVPDPQLVPDWSDENAQELCKELFVVADTSSSVTLDPCNSNLDFMIQADGLGGSPLTEGGFAHLLSGTKATWGVKKGQYFYECKVLYSDCTYPTMLSNCCTCIM